MDSLAIIPALYRAMKGLEEAVTAEADSAGIEPELRELMKIRASQLNGCAFCLDMHIVDGRKLGMSDQRIDVLAAWREADLYTPREQAALALTEAITLVHDGHVPDDVWNQAAEVFSERELAVVMWAAATINTWNRLAITGRKPVPAR